MREVGRVCNVRAHCDDLFASLNVFDAGPRRPEAGGVGCHGSIKMVARP
jgi:hypothetical protein